MTPTEPSIRINKNEMEAFLSDLLEFTSKYEMVLNELDLTRTRLEAISERIRDRVLKSAKALQQLREAIEGMCKRTEETLEGKMSE